MDRAQRQQHTVITLAIQLLVSVFIKIPFTVFVALYKSYFSAKCNASHMHFSWLLVSHLHFVCFLKNYNETGLVKRAYSLCFFFFLHISYMVKSVQECFQQGEHILEASQEKRKQLFDLEKPFFLPLFWALFGQLVSVAGRKLDSRLKLQSSENTFVCWFARLTISPQIPVPMPD